MQTRSFSSCRSLLLPRVLKRSPFADADIIANTSKSNKLMERSAVATGEQFGDIIDNVHDKKSFNNQERGFVAAVSHRNFEKSSLSKKKKMNTREAEVQAWEELEGKPIFPEKSWKPLQHSRVNFNLKKLKQLSGMEKIELLRDYLKTKSTSEAIYVYETIIYNCISNLLVYKDHHNLFRLLLKDPAQNKETILKIRHEMANNSFMPTAYFMNEYLVCCLKWGELKSALDVLQTALEERIPISLNTWQEVFEYHIKLSDWNSWNDAIALYKKLEAATPLVRPSLTIYLQVMALYTKLGQRAMVEQVYFEAAEDNLERLVGSQIKRMKWAREDEETIVWRANARTSLFNAYINSFLFDWKKVNEEFKEFANTGSILKMAVKSSPGTFHLLFKSLEFVESEPEEKNRLFQEYKHALLNEGFVVKTDYLHYSLMIEHAASVEEIRSLYRDATTNGLVHVPPSKVAHLDTSFISSLTGIDPAKGLEALEQVLDRSAPTTANGTDYKKPYRFVYLKLIDAFQSGGDLERAARVEALLAAGKIAIATKLLQSFLSLHLENAGSKRALEVQTQIRQLANGVLLEGSEQKALELLNCTKTFPYGLLSHSGTPTSTNDPLFTFANTAALNAFGYRHSEFIGMPSKFSAKPDHRDARLKMMVQAKEMGFNGAITGYAGERVHKSGKIFKIEEGIIWNLVDNEKIVGQAALLPRIII